MKTEDIRKELLDAEMYASMSESDFWGTSTISPREAMDLMSAWSRIYNLRLKSEAKQREFARKFKTHKSRKVSKC